MSVPEREEKAELASETGVAERAVAPPSPDGFRLEGEMPSVMRLSRRTLAIIGGTAGLAIAGALFWALRTPEPDRRENVYETDRPNRSELITGAVADYGAVPKLGPPLPGDLGRPIVSAQKDGEMITPPPDPRQRAADHARERRIQESDAARSSNLFLASGGGRASANASDQPAPPAAQAINPPGAEAPARTFRRGDGPRRMDSGERIVPLASPYVVQAGNIIPAALITGIRSDLPGQITAQVTQNIYDSPTGRILLIPQGSRLIGEYDSEIVAGQNRVLLAWDRLTFPGGRSIALGRLPGADIAGMAGLADRTDHHWGHMFKAALISTLLGVGAELGADDDDRLVRAIRSGSQDSIGQTGRQIVERQLAIPPTITIRPGFAFRVIVTRDLVLEPLFSSESR
ncbi:TrbI/VirB10 family protein [Sphingopyxis sp. SE2]|jgi:type IV secretion system protein VirB10|uniref:TrbI/VirB10 family protein n=2 Tax=Sphingopyxis TaxID=165697 RepID=UPI0028C27D04|nr:TrbI/VirB10 family protein [Sphingopyxis sp. SE2]MDT7529954.1 conjugal transfer protein TraI [Sphingopyxis sp. SE2]